MKSILLLLLGLISWAAAAAAPAVTLTWDPSPDAVAGYRLYYGTTSGSYSNVVEAGSNNFAPLLNLAVGTKYFFVVKSYSSAFVESDPSTEVSFTALAAMPRLVISSIVKSIGGIVQMTLSAPDLTALPVGVVRVYYSDDLVTWNWLNDAVVVAGNAVVIDPGAGTANRRFYRLSYSVQ